MAVEVVGLIDVGVGLREVAERCPNLQCRCNHIARVKLDEHLRNLSHDVSGSVDFANISAAECHAGLILLVCRLLIGEEEVEVETLERVGNHVCGPSPRLYVVCQRRCLDLAVVLQIERRVVVGLRDVREERCEAQPLVVVVDTCTAKRHAYLVGVRHRSRGECRDVRVLHDVGEVAGESEVVVQLICKGCCEVVVHPVVLHICRSNFCAIGSRCTEMVVGKTAHVVAGSILHGCVLALKALPLYTSAIVGVELRSDVPVVCEVEGELVLMSLVILRRVLIEIVEHTLCLVGIPKAHGVRSVFGYALVVHRSV